MSEGGGEAVRPRFWRRATRLYTKSPWMISMPHSVAWVILPLKEKAASAPSPCHVKILSSRLSTSRVTIARTLMSAWLTMARR